MLDKSVEEREMRADIERRLSEMKDLSWRYQQKFGQLTFLVDGDPGYMSRDTVEGARVLNHRNYITDFIPDSAVIAEIGTWAGDFARLIIAEKKPKEFYTIDIQYNQFKFDVMQSFIDSGILKTIEGDSATETAKFPESYFDVIYIDGDHSYDGVKRDIDAAAARVKPGGILVLNDYTNWSIFQFEKYGTVTAVSDFLRTHQWTLVYLALDPNGYHDIAFRRPLA